jgi:AcrR family transcriptional regulator
MNQAVREPVKIKRTQRERRKATINKLIEATIMTIEELGYHRSTVREICKRAGVSQGGLFRHFPSRRSLIIAAADEVGRRHTNRFLEMFQNLEPQADPLVSGLKFCRDAVRSPNQAVWHELVIAARTDPELKSSVTTIGKKLDDNIRNMATMAFSGLGVSEDRIIAATFLAIRFFDGEALARDTNKYPEQENLGLELLLEGLKNLIPE